jgi:hypothetical protein
LPAVVQATQAWVAYDVIASTTTVATATATIRRLPIWRHFLFLY